MKYFGVFVIIVEKKKMKMAFALLCVANLYIGRFSLPKTRDYFSPRNTSTGKNLMQTRLVFPYHLIIYP